MCFTNQNLSMSPCLVSGREGIRKSLAHNISHPILFLDTRRQGTMFSMKTLDPDDRSSIIHPSAGADHARPSFRGLEGRDQQEEGARHSSHQESLQGRLYFVLTFLLQTHSHGKCMCGEHRRMFIFFLQWLGRYHAITAAFLEQFEGGED